MLFEFNQSGTPAFPAEEIRGPTLMGSASLREAAWSSTKSAERRKESARRVTLLDETFEHHVQEVIEKTYNDPHVREMMSRAVSVQINPGGDAARVVPSVYSLGARRFLADVSDDVEERFASVLDEGGIWTQQQHFARVPYVTGQPLVVIPYVDEHGRLLRRLLPGHEYDAEVGEDGWIRAVIWATRRDPASAPDGSVAWVGVDEVSWYYFDSKGKPAAGPEGFAVVDHGAVDERGDPMCPAAAFRLNEPLGPHDWYTQGHGRRLWDATMTGGLLWARLNFRRKVQDGQLVVVRSQSVNAIPGGQHMADPEKPLVFTGNQGAGVSVDMLDHSTSPDDHLNHIRFVYESLFGAEGIPASDMTVTISGSAPAAQVSVRKERLAAVRSAQIPHVYQAERRLALATAAVIAGSDRHAANGRIPGPDDVAESFGCEWPTPTVDSPAEQREQDDWDRKHGLISVVDIALRRMPWLRTRKRALKFVERNVSEENTINELLAARNQTAGEDLVQSTAEANGRLGPMVRDGVTSDEEARSPDPTLDREGQP